ncbi:MAG TPA: molybdopterin molybdotransferase MoeA [Steroidobacteraceae bacterium]|nr:molybdopterin molybdotransferase MoeA [Steroidobacteraceae bacterium]
MLIPVEAEQLIEQHLPPRPIESLPLAQCSGAVLRENVYAERDQPPFDRVTMDGIALDSAATRDGARCLRVQAMQAAGDPPLTLAGPRSCIEVMTGAVLPAGCDAVVPVEQIRLENGAAELTTETAIEPWQNIHRRGSDAHQGALLLAAGTRLMAPEVAVAASAGLARIRVSRQPTLAVLSTGNELVEPGEPILAHQIRRSNVYGIIAALRSRGFQRVVDDHVRDEAEALESRLKFHFDTHDVLILSGGVSAGRFDLVPRALAALGTREVFHRVAQRPGKPLWFGVAPTGAAVFALPGNPVSTLICVSRYVLPALFAAMGQAAQPPERIALGEAVTVSIKLTVFLPVKLEIDDAGRTWALPRPTNGSGDFTALVGTDGFVQLPPGPNAYPRGFVTTVYRW